jgi:phosphate uptake regulator
MESRKVQRVGYSTFSVSLPKEWVRDSGLKQGDSVILSPEKDGSMRLFPSNMVEHRKQSEEYIINADLCSEPGMLERLIVGNYILGRDVFSIVSTTRISRAQVDEVRKITHRLMGLGIVQETSEQIDLQCSIDPTRFKIDMLLRRLSVIASTMHTEAMQALAESNQELADDAIRREDEADMMYSLALRLLLSAQRDRTMMDKIGLEEPSHILYYGLITRYLELIADRAEYIARRAIEFRARSREKTSGKQLMTRIVNIGELAHNIFLKAMDCVFTGDIEIANSLLEIARAILIEHEKLLKELPESPLLRTIVLMLDRIADHGASIAVIAINKALEKSSKICSVKTL